MSAGNKSGDTRPIPDAGSIAVYGQATGKPIAMLRGTAQGGSGVEIPVTAETRRVHKITVRALSAAGYEFFDYPAVYECGDAADMPPLAAALRAEGRKTKADIVFLNNLLWPEEIGEPPPEAGEILRFNALASENGWDFILKKSDVLRYRNKAKRELGYEAEHHLGDIEPALLAEIADLHAERWAFDGVASGLRAQERRDLYFAMRGIAAVTVLRSGTEIIAAHYGLRFGQTMIWHTPVINIRFLDHSPIKALLFEVAEYCRANALDVLDFGLGDEDYKIRFANEKKLLHEIFIPVSALGWFVGKAHAFAPMLAGGLKAMRAFARAARNGIRKFSNRIAYFEIPRGAEDRAAPVTDAEAAFFEIGNFQDFIDLCRRGGFTPQRFHRDRLRLGDRFLCAMTNEKIVSSGWAASGRRFVVDETGETLDLAAHQLLYDFYTGEEWRGRGHYTALLKDFARRHSDTAVLIYASRSNKASLTAIGKAGFEKLATTPLVKDRART